MKNYTKKKNLNDLDNYDGVISHLEPDIQECEVRWVQTSHLEPDIQECEVRWALGSITTNKASGGDRIPAELSQILKYDAVKVLH